MDWDLKMPPWDFSELEQNVEPSIGSGFSSSGGLGRQTGQLDCSVDLKLGGLGDFGPSAKWKEQPTVSTTVSSSGSSKRARAPGNASQNVSCAVEGCKSDLSNCREYHRRHKVCEVHSKTPVVRVGGQEQRFCQQCSRFHLLVEFDEEKRSCRKRLDGHNRRRRKLQPESCNSGGFFLNHQGTMFSSYPQMLPSSTTPEPKWPGFIKTEEEALYTPHPPLHYPGRQQHFPGSSISYREGKQFPFLQDGNTTLSSRMVLESSPLCQPLHKTISRVESSGSRMFSDGLAQALESDCALSLLSSPTQTPSINLGQLVQADRVSMGQPLVSGLQYGGLVGRYSRSQASNDVSTAGFSCSGIEEVERVGGALVSDDGDAGIHCQSMFHVVGEGSSDGASRALTFPWQ